MFDELFPGMGMAGMYGTMDPAMGMMFAGMPQYRQPGADVFSQMGVMSPQQQMFQGVELQNMMEQQQFARQQQMLAMRNMAMNMGAQAANVGTGFGGPLLQMMGGMQPAFSSGLTNGINQLIDLKNRGFQNGAPIGVMGSLSSDPNQFDPTALLAYARQKFPDDPAQANKWAGQQLIQAGQSSRNPTWEQAGVRLMDAGNALALSRGKTQADINKSNAQANESTARANELQAELSKPNPMGPFHDQQGNVGEGYSQYDVAKGAWNIKSTGWGKPIQYVLPQTPGDISKDIGDFRERLSDTEDAIARIRQVRQGLANGAAQGWTADGVKLVNDLQGSIEQLAPGSMLDSDGQKLLGTYKGDFNSWAQATGVNESTWADLTMALAKSYAKGGRISNQDIERAKESIGENYSDPRTVTAILNNVEQRTTGDVDRDYAYLRSSAMMPQQKQDIDNLYGTFKQRLTPAQNTRTRPPISSFYHQ